jgi:plastocyanin
MKRNKRLLIFLTGLLSLSVLLSSYLHGREKKKVKNDVCLAANGANVCSDSNTCGSATSACEIDVKRIGNNSASATPSFSGAKSNAPFCVKPGTTITFKSTSKNTGFVVDFGNSSPFDSGAVIMGGDDRPRSLQAKKPGCYTYSVGACTAGTIYGMCGEEVVQLVVSSK